MIFTSIVEVLGHDGRDEVVMSCCLLFQSFTVNNTNLGIDFISVVGGSGTALAAEGEVSVGVDDAGEDEEVDHDGDHPAQPERHQVEQSPPPGPVRGHAEHFVEVVARRENCAAVDAEGEADDEAVEDLAGQAEGVV